MAEPSAETQQAAVSALPLDPPQLITGVDGGSDAGHRAVDKHSVIQRIRDAVRSDPHLAETLALDDRQRFPNSPDSDERDALLVAAVFNQHQIDRARYETRYYFKHHPNGHYTEYLSKQTGEKPPSASYGR